MSAPTRVRNSAAITSTAAINASRGEIATAETFAGIEIGRRG
jgi:hypothetical protein